MNSTLIESPTVGAAVEAEEPAAKLPVHLPTLLTGVRSRLRVLLLAAGVALVMGMLGAKALGHKEFETTTVLLYKTPPVGGGGASAGQAVDPSDAPSLLTQMDMVKIPSNLEEVKRRLHLKDSPEKIGAAIKVDVPINSSIMVIDVKWPKADQAAEIANTAREVFLEQQLKLQHDEAASQIRDLVARQDKVMTELHTAEQNLKDFTIKNHVVDLDKEAGWYLQQLINTELVYEEAVGEDSATKLQEQNIGKIAAGLQQKMQAEEAQINSDPADRLTATEPATQADNAIKGRVADLRMKELEMDRAKTLADDGIYSRRQYEQAKAAYEQERFMLYKDSPSAALYKDMTLRELDVQLAHISDQQKVAHLREAVAHVHERLDALPLVQRDYMALQREVAIRAAERERIDLLLGIARRQNESQTFGFNLVSAAEPPLVPLKSNARLLFIAIGVVCMGAGLVLMLLLELLDRRLHSVGDARAKLSAEVLGGFEHGAFESGDGGDRSLTLMNRLRRAGVGAGSRVMVVSPTAGEGAPQVTEQLARSFANGGDSVLLIDGQFREVVPGSKPIAVRTGIRRRLEPVLALLQSRIVRPPLSESESTLSQAARAMHVPGFSDLLSGQSAQPLELDRRVRLMACGTAPRPELLLSNRLPQVLSESASSSDVTFVYATPMLEYPDATFLASSVRQALVVAASGKLTAGEVQRCVKQLEEAGVQVLGVVLTGIAPVYMERLAS